MCPESSEQREMAISGGFEKGRKTLKYRCPTAVYDLDCEGYRECHQQYGGQVSDYGRLVRIKLDKNRRIFTPTPRHTATWQKGYDLRSSLERIFSRLDQGYRFERHYIREQVIMKTRVSVAMAVMMALAHYRAERKYQMRSLVKIWRPPKAA